MKLGDLCMKASFCMPSTSNSALNYRVNAGATDDEYGGHEFPFIFSPVCDLQRNRFS